MVRFVRSTHSPASKQRRLSRTLEHPVKESGDLDRDSRFLPIQEPYKAGATFIEYDSVKRFLLPVVILRKVHLSPEEVLDEPRQALLPLLPDHVLVLVVWEQS